KPPALGDELDHIQLMALRKEPDRRYKSVEQFAADLERYLGQYPGLARPDTLTYRTRKYARRHWLENPTGAIVAASLITGSVVALRQARRAEARLGQVQRLSRQLIFDLHDEIATLPGATKARQKMVETGIAYLDSIVPDAGSDANLRLDLAE